MDDADYVRLSFVASTPRLRAIAEDRVRSSRRETQWLRDKGLEAEDVAVLPWPTSEVVVRIIDQDSQAVLAAGQAPIPSGDRAHYYDVSVVPTSFGSAQLCDRLSEGSIRIHLGLGYPGVRIETAKAESLASIRLQSAITKALEHANLGPNVPIFQNQERALRSQLTEERATIVSAESAEVAKMIDTVSLERILPALDWQPYEEQDADFQKALAAYLEPQIETIVAARKEYESETDTREIADSVKLSPGGKSGPFDLSRGETRTLVATSGVDFTETTTDSVLKPSRALVTYFNTDWRDESRRAIAYAHLVTATSDAIVAEDAIRPSFNEASIKEILDGRDTHDYYSEIPLGASFCYFGSGQNPPNGFAWADGRTDWPSASWVPEELRSTPVPDLTDRFMSGTDSEESVAREYESSFAILQRPAEKTSVLFSGAGYVLDGEVPVPKLFGSKDPIGWHVPLYPIFAPNTHPAGNDIAGSAGGQFPGLLGVNAANPLKLKKVTIKAVEHAFPEKERTIDLSTAEAAPPHIKCRWIIRVN